MGVKTYGDLERRLRNRVVEKSRALRRQPRVVYQMGADDALDRAAADAISVMRNVIEQLERSQDTAPMSRSLRTRSST
jgi:hypothetical protein